jgi:hypothetical protein
VVTSLTLTAVDLSKMDRSIDSYQVGDYIQVVSKPHAVDDYFRLTDCTEDLLKPENNTIVLGADVKSLTYQTNAEGRVVNKRIESATIDLKNKVQSAQNSVSDLKNQVEGIDGTYFYIKYSPYADGHVMTDAPNDSTQYMGTCSTNTATAPTDPSKYTWCKVKGDNGVDGENAIVCYIDSSTGYTFKEGETATLTARLFDGTEEIDPDGQAPYTWYRKIDGGNYSAFANGKTITISEDVFSQNMDIYFVCGIEDEVDNRAIVGVAVTGVAIVGKG